MTDDAASARLRHTALAGRHRELGARLAPFAGWEMPIEFAGTLDEHRAVRASVGVFDVSHLGTIWLTGPDAGEVVARSFTNDPSTLADGSSQYTLCATPQGGIDDDLIVYRLAAERWLAVPNAANTPTVRQVLEEAADGRRCDVHDASEGYAILAVQGPAALDTLGSVLDLDAAAVPYLGLQAIRRDGEEVLLCRTGYTGEPGAELVAPVTIAVGLWDAVLAAGAVPVGLAARDTLRLEMGYPLHGNDLTPDTDPFEARLGWAVTVDRGPFRGREALLARKQEGPRRRLLGLRGSSRRPPRAGMRILVDDRTVGGVTSGSFSPTLGVGIGLGYVEAGVTPGERVTVDVRGRREPFEVVRPPLVDRDPRG